MATMDSPFITIIVAVFNGVDTLEKCLASISTQSYARKQLIVIDGGSTDGCIDTLKRYASVIDYWVSESDSGIYHAWNKALRHARGDWVCFLGADDFFWQSDVLEQMAPFLAAAYPGTRVVYGQIATVNRTGTIVQRLGDYWETARRLMPQLMAVPHAGLMHHRSLFEEHGQFDESFRIAGDYELLLRELLANDASFIPNLITVGMREGGISSQPGNTILMLKECRRAQKSHGLIRPGMRWLLALAMAYIRSSIWKAFGREYGSRLIDGIRVLFGKTPYWSQL